MNEIFDLNIKNIEIYYKKMSSIFTQLGSLISGIREKLHEASNTNIDTHPEPEQTINEDIHQF